MADLSAFDLLAHTYDDEFTLTSIGRLQRLRVWQQLSKILKNENKAIHVLEINCGTGEDAIFLAKLGINVSATDMSEEMIIAAKQKACNSSVNVKFECCSFEKLSEKFKNAQFDVIFSNFGGLNCINSDEIISLANDIQKLLSPSGKAIFVIMGSACIWERMYFLLKGAPRQSGRRKEKHGIPVQIKGLTVKTYYYKPSAIKKYFNHGFYYLYKMPIGLFIPPSYLQPAFTKRPKLLNFLNFLERLFAKASFLSNFADHYLVTFEKKTNTGL